MHFHSRRRGPVLRVGDQRASLLQSVPNATFEHDGRMIGLFEACDVQIRDLERKDRMSNHREDNSRARIRLNLMRRVERDEDCARERKHVRGPGGDMLVFGTPDGGRNQGCGAADCNPQSRRQKSERGVQCDRRSEPQTVIRPLRPSSAGEHERRRPAGDFDTPRRRVGAGSNGQHQGDTERGSHALTLIAVLAVAILASCASGPRPLPAGNALSSLATAGPYAVARYDVEWFDAARNRNVPARIYAPVGPTSLPVIIFSHGLGNSRFGYSYLGEHWASHGYVSVHPEHLGANFEVERHGLWRLFRAGFDRRNWRNVPLDIRFVIDQLQGDAALPEPLRGRIDRSRIGVSGHSLGAYGALAIGGMSVLFPDGSVFIFRDDRVRAAVPISMSENFKPSSYGTVAIPMLHLTGTHDSSIFYGTLPRKRRIPYNSIPRSDQYLVVIRGANHSTFSDEERPGNRPAHDVIRASTLLFWNAYLKGDPAALRQLRDGTLQKFLVESATLREK
jgi:predicted dienelactone hydrolase